VGVRLGRLAERAPRRLAIPFPAKGQQGSRVHPGRRFVLRVLAQEAIQLVLPVEVQQTLRQQVPDPLVVAGVEPEHVLVVGQGLLKAAGRPKTLGQPQPGPHVGSRLQQPPEPAGVLSKEPLAQGPLPGGHPLLVQLQGLLERLGVFGQKDVGVRAVGRDLEGLSGQGDLLLVAVGLEGVVDQLLGTLQGGIPAPAADPGKHLLHHPFQRAPVQWRQALVPFLGRLFPADVFLGRFSLLS